MKEVTYLKLLRQLGIILGILFGSHLLQKVTGLPIPGTVLGMIILLIGLMTGLIKIEMVSEVSQFLLDHLVFFFIPAGVGIMTSIDIIKDKWLPLLIVTILTTVIVLVVTGLTVQALKREKERNI